MIVLSCSDLSLSFGTDVVFDGVSFALNEGERMGIVGVNGAGKSSLFRVITGEYTPDRGSVSIAKDTRVGVLEQNIAFASEKTVLEEALFLFADLHRREEELNALQTAMERDPDDVRSAERYATLHDRFVRDGGYEYQGRCRGMLRRFGFDESMWDLPAASLSGGQKTRLALARLLLSQPDILMLDEPTNHLDRETLFWLEDYLRIYPKTVIVISHDRYFLDRTVNRILEIENHSAKVYNGNYSTYAEKKKTDREIQERHYKNQQREIARIEAYIEQQRRWNRERNIIAAESREKQLAKMERVEKPSALPRNIRMQFSASGESGNDVLISRGLCMGYGEKQLFADVDFLIKRGDRAFIVGQNGCGKSTLLKIITGHLMPTGGALDLGYNVNIGYYDQENQNLDPENTVIDELWNENPERTQTEIRNTLALFLFCADDVQKKVGVLSGGEKARLTLAKLLLSKMNLLVLDEPTNHLDIPSREALENAIEQFEGTVVAVSHDRYFIRKLATRILAFGTAGQELYDFRGGYEDYLAFEQKQTVREIEQAKTEVSAEKAKFLNVKKSRSDERKQEARRRNTERDIARAEAEIAQIDEELTGEIASDYVRVAELEAKKEDLEQKLLALYETLEELESD